MSINGDDVHAIWRVACRNKGLARPGMAQGRRAGRRTRHLAQWVGGWNMKQIQMRGAGPDGQSANPWPSPIGLGTRVRIAAIISGR
jgi:hypothetical protein